MKGFFTQKSVEVFGKIYHNAILTFGVMDNYVTLAPASCLVLESQSVKICLPEKKVCYEQPTDGLLAECGSTWNCVKCATDSNYQIPFVRGDKIQIQTIFFDSYNPDPTNPANGFGSFVEVEFCGNDTGTTTSIGAFASRSMVAYGCGRSYQIIEVDTSLFTDCLFSIKFTAKDSSGNVTQEVCSQEFGETSCGGAKTFTIKGDHSFQDCFRHCYGTPDAYTGDLIEYDNTLRYYGGVKAGDISVDKTTVSNFSTSVSVQDSIVIQLGRKIPPFAHKVLAKQLLAGDTIAIDGKEYTVDSYSTNNEIDIGTMFLYSMTVFQECDNVKGCN